MVNLHTNFNVGVSVDEGEELFKDGQAAAADFCQVGFEHVALALFDGVVDGLQDHPQYLHDGHQQRAENARAEMVAHCANQTLAHRCLQIGFPPEMVQFS